MPSGFAALDTGFPQLEGIDGTDARLRALEDYLVQLLEQLRYTLHNLGVENLNTTEVKGWMGEVIEEPLRIALENVEEGLTTRISITEAGLRSEVTRATGAEDELSSSITQTAEAITAEVTRATGAESTLRQTADGISTRVTTAEGNISTLTQTAEGLRTDVDSADGKASTAQQTADAIKAQVTDGSGNYTVVNLKSDGLHIGNASGTTTISGGSITAGSITAGNLAANAVTAEKINAGAVTTNKLAANAVTAEKISASYVYAGEISADQITSGAIDSRYVSVKGLLGVYVGSTLSGAIGGDTGSTGSGTTYGAKLVGSNVNNYVFASGGGAGLFSGSNSLYVTPQTVAGVVNGTAFSIGTMAEDIQDLKRRVSALEGG